MLASGETHIEGIPMGSGPPVHLHPTAPSTVSVHRHGLSGQPAWRGENPRPQGNPPAKGAASAIDAPGPVATLRYDGIK